MTRLPQDITTGICVGILVMMLMAVRMLRKRVLMTYLRVTGVAACLLGIVGLVVLSGMRTVRPHIGLGHAIGIVAALGVLMVLTSGAMRRADGGVWEQRWGALTVAVITQAGFLLVSVLLVGPKWLDVLEFVGVVEAEGLVVMGFHVLNETCRPWRESEFRPIALAMLLMGLVGSAAMVSLRLPMWVPIGWSVVLVWMVALASKQLRYRILRRARGPRIAQGPAMHEHSRAMRAHGQAMAAHNQALEELQRRAAPPEASVGELNALLDQVLEEKAKKDASLPTWFDRIMKDD